MNTTQCKTREMNEHLRNLDSACIKKIIAAQKFVADHFLQPILTNFLGKQSSVIDFLIGQ